MLVLLFTTIWNIFQWLNAELTETILRFMQAAVRTERMVRRNPWPERRSIGLSRKTRQGSQRRLLWCQETVGHAPLRRRSHRFSEIKRRRSKPTGGRADGQRDADRITEAVFRQTIAMDIRGRCPAGPNTDSLILCWLHRPVARQCVIKARQWQAVHFARPPTLNPGCRHPRCGPSLAVRLLCWINWFIGRRVVRKLQR